MTEIMRERERGEILTAIMRERERGEILTAIMREIERESACGYIEGDNETDRKRERESVVKYSRR